MKEQTKNHILSIIILLLLSLSSLHFTSCNNPVSEQQTDSDTLELEPMMQLVINSFETIYTNPTYEIYNNHIRISASSNSTSFTILFKLDELTPEIDTIYLDANATYYFGGDTTTVPVKATLVKQNMSLLGEINLKTPNDSTIKEYFAIPSFVAKQIDYIPELSRSEIRLHHPYYDEIHHFLGDTVPFHMVLKHSYGSYDSTSSLPVIWESNIDGILKEATVQNNFFETDTLSSGVHNITVSVENSMSEKISRTFTIYYNALTLAVSYDSIATIERGPWRKDDFDKCLLYRSGKQILSTIHHDSTIFVDTNMIFGDENKYEAKIILLNGDTVTSKIETVIPGEFIDMPFPASKWTNSAGTNEIMVTSYDLYENNGGFCIVDTKEKTIVDHFKNRSEIEKFEFSAKNVYFTTHDYYDRTATLYIYNREMNQISTSISLENTPHRLLPVGDSTLFYDYKDDLYKVTLNTKEVFQVLDTGCHSLGINRDSTSLLIKTYWDTLLHYNIETQVVDTQVIDSAYRGYFKQVDHNIIVKDSILLNNDFEHIHTFSDSIKALNFSGTYALLDSTIYSGTNFSSADTISHLSKYHYYHDWIFTENSVVQLFKSYNSIDTTVSSRLYLRDYKEQ